MFVLIICFRYARSVGLVESVSARKFLEAAMGSGDEQVFYSTFIFFSLRNTRLRGSAAFARGMCLIWDCGCCCYFGGFYCSSKKSLIIFFISQLIVILALILVSFGYFHKLEGDMKGNTCDNVIMYSQLTSQRHFLRGICDRKAHKPI